jgi:hypothetical protein
LISCGCVLCLANVLEVSPVLAVVDSSLEHGSLLSFDLGLDLDGAICSPDVVDKSVTMPIVTKKSRRGKRVAISEEGPSVVIANKRCFSFEDICSAARFDSSTQLIHTPRLCDIGSFLLNSRVSDMSVAVVEIDSRMVEEISEERNTEINEEHGIEIPVPYEDFVVSEVESDVDVSHLVDASEIAIIDEASSGFAQFDEQEFQREMSIKDTKGKGKLSGFAKFDEAAFTKDMNSSEKNGTVKSNQWVKNRFNA